MVPYCDALTPQAKAVGSVNTTYFETDAYGRTIHVGTNLDLMGVRNSLLTVLSSQVSPFPASMPMSFAPNQAAGLCIGGGGATRAAVVRFRLILCEGNLCADEKT